jgi:mRNA interferase MazF
MNRHLDTIVVCPLTTKLHPRWRSRIQVICARRKAEIAIDQIRTISKDRLGKRLDRLSVADAGHLRRLIVEMYGE